MRFKTKLMKNAIIILEGIKKDKKKRRKRRNGKNKKEEKRRRKKKVNKEKGLRSIA